MCFTYNQREQKDGQRTAEVSSNYLEDFVSTKKWSKPRPFRGASLSMMMPVPGSFAFYLSKNKRKAVDILIDDQEMALSPANPLGPINLLTETMKQTQGRGRDTLHTQ